MAFKSHQNRSIQLGSERFFVSLSFRVVRSPTPMPLTKPITLRFEGEMGERFCKEFVYHPTSDRARVSDAIAACNCNHPELLPWIYQCVDEGINFYAIDITTETPLTDADLEFPIAPGEVIAIGVAPTGSGDFIQGVALIGIGIITGGTGLIVAGGLTILRGVLSRAIAPNNEKEKKDKRKSTYFSAQSENAKDGIVPRLYGSSIDEAGNLIGRRIPAQYVSMLIENVPIADED